MGGLYTAIGGPGMLGIMVRALFCALFLLPPTIMMGATLPAISRWVETTRRGVSWLGFFYGGNTFGAVLGCLLTGFYLLRVHDVAIATYAAVALNALVAASGLILAKKTAYEASDAADEIGPGEDEPATRHAMPRSESSPSKYPTSIIRKYTPGAILGRPYGPW